MGSGGSTEASPEAIEFAAEVNHRAIERGIQSNNISTFYFPIHTGADVNRRNKDGVTLLEMGIDLQRVEVVGFLCSLPETDKSLKTSKGKLPLEHAIEMRAQLEGAHEDKILGADAIVDLIQNARSARLFRIAYNMHIDKVLYKQQMRRQGAFGFFWIFSILAIHLVPFLQPEAGLSEMLRLSPIYHLMNGTQKLFWAKLAELGLGGKEEL